MSARPFTLLTALLLLILALFHVSRWIMGFQIVVGTQPMPMSVSIAT